MKKKLSPAQLDVLQKMYEGQTLVSGRNTRDGVYLESDECFAVRKRVSYATFKALSEYGMLNSHFLPKHPEWVYRYSLAEAGFAAVGCEDVEKIADHIRKERAKWEKFE